DRLVRDARHLRVGEALRELRLRREVEVRVEHEPFAEEAVLGRERLLDLHNHLGAPRLGGGADDLRAGGDVLAVLDAPAFARAALEEDLVAARREAASPRGGHADSVLARLDLFGDSDEHGAAPWRGGENPRER